MAFYGFDTFGNELVECEPSFGAIVSAPEKSPVTVTTRIEQEAAFSVDNELKIESPLCKVKLPEFPINRPWLPQQALTIIDKIRKGPVSEKQLLVLMDIVAEQAADHFQIQAGKFVASTFLGKIVEVAETRVGLLKKIQSRPFTEEIFVWRAGFKSFSGRP
jgi:hypothetical protein